MPLLDGSQVRYVNPDNAASTPPLRRVVQTIQGFIPYYSGVHRGSGFKSRLSSGVYEQARDIVAEFVNAEPATHRVIFGKIATEAINKLAYRLDLPSGAMVITTMLEHHSNDLPWRGRAELVHVGLTSDRRLDESEFDEKLAQYADRVDDRDPRSSTDVATGDVRRQPHSNPRILRTGLDVPREPRLSGRRTSAPTSLVPSSRRDAITSRSDRGDLALILARTKHRPTAPDR